MPALKDLTGQRFGKLLVIERDFEYNKIHQTKSKAPYWKCQCDCGNVITVRADSLTTGRTVSCGCFRKIQSRKATMKNLKGQYFNNIEVIEDLNEFTNTHRRLHLCRCGYCGTIFKVNTNDLTAQKIESCGCLKSKGEQKLIKIFIQNNISYKKEYTFDDLYLEKDIYKKHPLRFDFFLPDYNVLIEYQGNQHYDKKSRYYSEQGTYNDNLKKEYCKNKKIKLIEINYQDYDKLDYAYLINLLK